MGRLENTNSFSTLKKPPRNRIFENVTTNFLKETSVIKKIIKKTILSLHTFITNEKVLSTLLVTWQRFVCNFTVKIDSTLPVFIYSFIRNVMIAWIISSTVAIPKDFLQRKEPKKDLLFVQYLLRNYYLSSVKL